MANRHRGDTPIEVGNERFTLCYDLNACSMVMDRLGIKSFEGIAELDLSGISLGDVIYMLWAGLQRYHENMSLKDVGALEWDLNEHLPVIGQAITRGLVRQAPQQAETSSGDDDTEGRAEGNVPARRRRGTGKKPSD